METKTLRLYQLVFKNIKHQKLKSIFVFILYFVTTLFILTSITVVKSAKLGIDESKNKLGADLVVLPDTANDIQPEEILYNGTPCTIQMDKSVQNELSTLPHINNIVSRLYLATLGGQSCCDGQIQLIATDIDKDFLLKPWLTNDNIHIADNEIIMGSRLGVEVGDTVKYLNREFIVVDVMDKTNTGYDYSGFITFKTAYEIIQDPMYEDLFKDFTTDSISMVFIDSNSPKVLNNIIKSKYGNNYTIYVPDKKIAEYTASIGIITVATNFLSVLLTILGLLSVGTIIFMNTIVRKNEIGTYFIIGMKRTTLLWLFSLEQIIVVTFSILSSYIVYFFLKGLFGRLIEANLNLPMKDIAIQSYIVLLISILVIGIILSVIASIFGTITTITKNKATLIKEAN